MDQAVPVHVVSPSADRRRGLAERLEHRSVIEHDGVAPLLDGVAGDGEAAEGRDPAGGGPAGQAGDPAQHRIPGDSRAPADRRAIVVDVPGGVDADAVLRLCREIADRDLKWTVYVPGEVGGEMTFRPLAVGFPVRPDDLVLSDGGGSGREGGNGAGTGGSAPRGANRAAGRNGPGHGADVDEAPWPPFDLHEILRFISRIRHDINNPLTAGMAETQLLLMDLGSEGEVGESLETIQRQLKRIQNLVQDLGTLRRPRPTGRGSGSGGG